MNSNNISSFLSSQADMPTEPQADLPSDAGAILLPLARAAIQRAAGAQTPIKTRGKSNETKTAQASSNLVNDTDEKDEHSHQTDTRTLRDWDLGALTVQYPWLARPGACFVTLNEAGQLRGCIGSLVAHRSLLDDVCANAVSAAMGDPRFFPVQADEVDDLHIEVSVLTDPHPLSFTDKKDALDQLRPGVDGVILSLHGYRATYLPQVWEQLPGKEEFIRSLARKAGLPARVMEGPWPKGLTLDTYQVHAWEEA